MAKRGFPSLHPLLPAALVLLAAAVSPRALAQGTYYSYNDCPSACATPCATTTPYGGICSCIDYCQNCFSGYYYRCYEKFYIGDNGTSWTYSCSCYWPWWAWLLFSIGLALLLGGCIFGILSCVRRRKQQQELNAQIYQQQMGAVPPPAPGYPAPAGGYPPPAGPTPPAP